MNKKYNVNVKLDEYNIIVPVVAIDEDDAKHEAMHILYWKVLTGVNIEIGDAVLV
jgi:hypothetical protein